ncbi:MAG: DUF5666 domain-containing protein [Candidatus Thiodiazotropha endolucinida]
MFMQKVYRLLTIVLVVPLISCGGSSVELSYDGPTINVPDFIPPSHSPTTVISIGPITAMSSISVNGATYDTDTATITLNGKPGVPDDLHPGYVVAVYGTLDAGWKSGTAERISFNANVVGPVEGVDPVDRRLSIMGQRVRIDMDTRIAPPLDADSLFNLTIGTTIQVSGLLNVDGEIIATHIQLENGQESFQVIGEVSEIDHGEMTFKINGLTVDYSNTLLMDLPDGAPSRGLVVIARGSLDSDGFLQVAELTSHMQTSEFVTGSLVQLTGFIMRYNLNTELFVNSLGVETAFHTIFHNGLFSDLVLGIKVEIDGRWGIGNSVIAEEIWLGN